MADDSNFRVLSLQNLKMALSLNPFDLMGNLIARHLLVIYREQMWRRSHWSKMWRKSFLRIGSAHPFLRKFCWKRPFQLKRIRNSIPPRCLWWSKSKGWRGSQWKSSISIVRIVKVGEVLTDGSFISSAPHINSSLLATTSNALWRRIQNFGKF